MDTRKDRQHSDTPPIPTAQYLDPDRAVEAMAMFGARRVLKNSSAAYRNAGGVWRRSHRYGGTLFCAALRRGGDARASPAARRIGGSPQVFSL
jgi:hypothetical protein